MTAQPDTTLERRAVVSALLKDRGSMLVIAGLGSSAWDVASVEDNLLDFPMWGGMGAPAMIGLGLAHAQPGRRVLVITGDGDLMMGMGSLATIATQAPENLSLAVLDNERHGETGMQRGLTASGVDIAGIARACGFKAAHTVRGDQELEARIKLMRQGPGLALCVFKIKAEAAPRVLPPREGSYLKDRFREALLGPEAMR